MMGAKEDFAIVCGWIAVVAVNVIFGAGEFYGLIGAGINSKKTASKSLGNVGITIFIWDVEAREGIKDFGSDGLDGIIFGGDGNEFIINNKAAEAKDGEK